MTTPPESLRQASSVPLVPWWYERIVGGLACATLGFALVGMALALVGWFRIGPGIALGVALSYSFYLQWFGSSMRQQASPTGQVSAAIAIAIAVCSLVFNWTAAAEDYLTDGETGVMVTAARHLDVTGSLTTEASLGPFSDARVGFVADGFTGRGVGGELTSDVPHLVPVLRGVAGWFGQTPLLAIGAVFGAALLLALYWMASRFLPQPLALAVMGSMALTLPFVQASRAFYPEVVAGFGVLAGLALLWGLSDSRDGWRGAIAGMLMGLAVLARGEWAVLAIPVGLFVVAELAHSTGMSWMGGSSHRRFVAAVAGGFAVPVAVAVADASRRTIDLAETFEPRRAVTLLGVAAVVFGVLRMARSGLGEQPRFGYGDMRRTVAALVAGAVVVGSVAMFLRPVAVAEEPSIAVATAQLAEGVTVDPVRSYDESTGMWLVWYLGVFMLVAGVAGLMLLIWEAVDDRRMLPFLAVTLVLSFAAVADAGPLPVQVLASRRLLVITIPAALIGVGFVAMRLIQRAPPAWVPVAVTVVAVAMIATPLSHLSDIAELSSHRGARTGIEELCGALDARRDVVLFAETTTEAPGAVAAQTVRDFCRVPAARAVEPSPDEILALARAWQVEGRNLVVASASPWQGLEGSRRIVVAWRSLERTVESRPDAAESGSFTLYLAPAE